MKVFYENGDMQEAEWVEFWHEDNTVLVKVKGGELEQVQLNDIYKVEQ